MSNENIEYLDEIVANADKFVENTVKEYKDEIEKYSLEIDRGNDTVFNYAYLFLNYRGLYEFTKKERKYRCVDKSVVDNICEKFLSKVQEEMAADQNMSANYCHLATIYSYRGDNKSALEFYDKAVELDSSKIFERGEFKNNILNDRTGALEDFNKALELADNDEDRECIKLFIDQIDILRSVKSSTIAFWVYVTFLYLVIGVVVIIMCLSFYAMIKPAIDAFN